MGPGCDYGARCPDAARRAALFSSEPEHAPYPAYLRRRQEGPGAALLGGRAYRHDDRRDRGGAHRPWTRPKSADTRRQTHAPAGVLRPGHAPDLARHAVARTAGRTPALSIVKSVLNPDSTLMTDVRSSPPAPA